MGQASLVATGLARGTQQEIVEQIGGAITQTFVETPPALIVIFAAIRHDLGALSRALGACFPKAKLIGSSTAGELTEDGDVRDSVAFFALGGDVVVQAGIGVGLEDDVVGAVNEALAGMEVEYDGYDNRCAILLLDALAGSGEEAVLATAVALGEGFKLAGGAAGDDLRMESTKVVAGDRVASDAVVLATVHSRQPIGLGVAHGHRPFTDPVTVTRADGNIVRELDGRPAFDVWRDAIRSKAKAQGLDLDALAPSEAGEALLRYEAALAAGAAWKIRAPLSVDEEGAIHFACGLPEGSVIRFTESSSDEQVRSARAAAQQAAAELGDTPVAGALVFDCICRKLILGDDFAGAVRTMSKALGAAPLAGFETYGEIALEAGDLSGFHNTTTVVLAFA